VTKRTFLTMLAGGLLLLGVAALTVSAGGAAAGQPPYPTPYPEPSGFPLPPSPRPDCDAPRHLATGRWSGRFEVQWDLRWTADLGNRPTSSETAPAVWQSKRTIRGEIDLLVSESAIEGVARASWQSDTTAERADGARQEARASGLLSGGSLLLPSGRELAAGDAIEWRGAWETRPAGAADENFSATITYRSADGRTLHGDGHVLARPVGPIAFQVTSVTCSRITGTADPAAFGYPNVGPEAGLTVVHATATFTVDWRPRP